MHMLLSPARLIVVLVLFFILLIATGPSVGAGFRRPVDKSIPLQSVVFLREVYEVDGHWRLIVDEVSGVLGEECDGGLETGCAEDNDGRGPTPSIVEYSISGRLGLITYDQTGEMEQAIMTPRRLRNFLQQNLDLQSVPFVMTASGGEVSSLEEVYDPLI